MHKRPKETFSSSVGVSFHSIILVLLHSTSDTWSSALLPWLSPFLSPFSQKKRKNDFPRKQTPDFFRSFTIEKPLSYSISDDCVAQWFIL